KIQKLEQLERDARRKKLGAWAISGQPLKWPSATPQPSADASHSISATPVPLIATGSPIDVKRPHAKETPELGRIDVNTATEKELRMVPGIGPVMAARIIAARPFRSANGLKRVSGIGE